MREGVVVKACGGFFYVKEGDKVWECFLRGKLRKQGERILVGDRVRFRESDRERGVVEEVLPRRLALVRPPVANVDQVIIVFAVADPDPNISLLDRLLVQVGHAGPEAVICFNKADLEGEDPYRLRDIYQRAGYKFLITSTVTGQGIDELAETLKNRITVFAGPSGAGKSSLLNALNPGWQLKTGEVSAKIGRGRHTTRHVELLELKEGGFVADTPGFSSLYLPEIAPEELAAYFPEFSEPAQECRFTSCLHHREPDCGVKKAVEEGQIPSSRYRNYLAFLEELREMEERRYRE
ncbi:MAG: ribosome biosis GTPase / thiamine phosphate phosphatase [Eubacteriales bacterium]|nr:ribosome biosis GTPase / thiamine phosphate phosphatase [Eubacteriales bacterium]